MEVIARYSDISNLVCSKEQFKSIIDELVQDYGLSHFGYGDKYKLNNTILDFYSNGGFNAKVNVKQNDILIYKTPFGDSLLYSTPVFDDKFHIKDRRKISMERDRDSISHVIEKIQNEHNETNDKKFLNDVFLWRL